MNIFKVPVYTKISILYGTIYLVGGRGGRTGRSFDETAEKKDNSCLQVWTQFLANK